MTNLNRCLKMFADREAFYRREWKLRGKKEDLAVAMAYNSAREMLSYAMNDNIECLAQYDYFNTDEEWED